MKKFAIILLLAASLCLCGYRSADWSNVVADMDIADTANQIIYVLADGSNAEVSMYEKSKSGKWQILLSTKGHVGKNGIGEHIEGDGKTPEGCFSLSSAFGTRPAPDTEFPYVQVDKSHYWVDDIDSKYYNQFVSTDEVEADWNSAEHIIDHDATYAYAIALDYNTDCIPGNGSAISLHCDIGRATSGCISVPEKDMEYILKHITDGAYIVIKPDI